MTDILNKQALIQEKIRDILFKGKTTAQFGELENMTLGFIKSCQECKRHENILNGLDKTARPIRYLTRLIDEGCKNRSKIRDWIAFNAGKGEWKHTDQDKEETQELFRKIENLNLADLFPDTIWSDEEYKKHLEGAFEIINTAQEIYQPLVENP